MSINSYRERFYKLLESTMGDVKPLICESEIGEDKLDLTSTYLNPEDISTKKEVTKIRRETPIVVDLKGKIFKGAESKQGDTYGIDFENVGAGYYKVIFPDDFIEKYFLVPSNQVYKNMGSYGNEHGEQLVPLMVNIPHYGERNIEELLYGIIISKEQYPTNRIHFSGGISQALQGIGLGYIIYQSFIHYLGHGSSLPNASDKAKIIWSKLAQDPDFYSFTIKLGSTESIVVISKTLDKDSIKKIFNDIIKYYREGYDGEIDFNLGEDLKNDFPNLVDDSLKQMSTKDELLLNTLETLESKLNLLINDPTVNLSLNFISDTKDLSDKFFENLTKENYTLVIQKIKILFDKFINKFYDKNSVSFDSKVRAGQIPLWNRIDSEGKIRTPEDISKLINSSDGSTKMYYFELSLNYFAEFFYIFFNRIKILNR